MVASDITSPVTPSTAPARKVRRRRRWVLLAGALLLLAGGLAAPEGWGAWQEHAALRALEEEHLDEAQRHVEQALRVRPGRESTNVLAARIARLRGAYSAAEEYLGRCGGPDELSERVQLEWLLLRCDRGELDALAPGLFALVERGHPDAEVILETLSSLYMRQTRYDAALHCLDRWVERQPDSIRALHWRGWVSNQMDHRGQALADYERVLELQPENAAVRLGLAQILIDSSRSAEALPYLEPLQKEQPDNPDVLVGLARCRMAQARRNEARELLDTVLAAHPDHADALYQRGKLELDERHFVEAERWLRKALERAPAEAEVRYSLYLSLQSQGNRTEEARRELERWEQGRKAQDRLMRLLRTELALRPNDANLAAETGELFFQLGVDDKALFWLHRALELDPRNVASHRALLAYYERTNNPARAEEHRKQLAALEAGK